MRRHCDGKDPNLIMYLHEKTGAITDSDQHLLEPRTIPYPCTCGLVFDDVYRSTIYPHHAI